MDDTVFRVGSVSKTFSNFRALSDVSLSIRKGESRAIIGPNGAGKTTFVNVVSGVMRPTTGQIFLDGKDITRLSPQRRTRLGLSRTFQISSLFRGMTVSEHLKLALRGGGKDGGDEEELLRQFGLGGVADRNVETLSHGEQRVLEIMMALGLRPRLLLLDEPTAGMSIAETNRMIELINTHIRGDISMIIIEHDMSVVMRTADRITVLAEGRVAAEGAPDAILSNPLVREIYLGSASGY
ncbi:MAG: ABC transporter ATP-binding protein [Parvibaculaceae bacterium]